MKQAQTILDLREQLRQLGWAPEDRVLIDQAYAQACRLFSAKFRGAGRPFLCHLVGTASIVAGHGANAEVVSAALLHAAYRQGDFGTHTGRPRRAQRADMARRFGAVVQDLIQEYGDLDWAQMIRLDTAALTAVAAGVPSQVLFIRAANELEDSQEYPFYPRDEQEARMAGLAAAARLARIAGYPALERQIDQRLRELASPRQDLATGTSSSSFSSSYTLIPLSCGRKPVLVLLRNIRAGLWHVKKFLRARGTA